MCPKLVLFLLRHPIHCYDGSFFPHECLFTVAKLGEVPLNMTALVRSPECFSYSTKSTQSTSQVCDSYCLPRRELPCKALHPSHREQLEVQRLVKGHFHTQRGYDTQLTRAAGPLLTNLKDTSTFLGFFWLGYSFYLCYVP